MPDFQCSWWPDVWFGVSLTDCCIAHDLGGADLALAQCVAHKGPFWIIMGIVMFIGVKIGRPVYLAWRDRNKK